MSNINLQRIALPTGVELDVAIAGDPANPATQIAAFNSPTALLGPRVFRFNITYEFGR